MGEPRTVREVLIAQMLGELDELLRRAEQLPKTITDAETRVATTVRVLDDAGDRYRLAVTAFTEEAKRTLTEHLQTTMQRFATVSLEQHRVALREAAQAAFTEEALSRATQVKNWQEEQATEFGSRRGARLFEHFVVASLASTLTAILVLLIERLS